LFFFAIGEMVDNFTKEFCGDMRSGVELGREREKLRTLDQFASDGELFGIATKQQCSMRKYL
jgi:hypothetical protein